jgi:hypothetical protein
MGYVTKALEIIKARYDSEEYKAGIEAITIPEQKMYGAVDKKHTQDVLEWTLKLWSETPDALKIAAAGHDWDRAWESERDKLEVYPKVDGKPPKEWYDIHKAMHSANTARILRRELSEILTSEMMNDVVYLVLRHEIGGRKDNDGSLIYLEDNATKSYNLNKAADILQKADSLSFFSFLDMYVEWKTPEKAEQKFRYMYDRIEAEDIKKHIRELKFNNPKAIEIFEKVLG